MLLKLTKRKISQFSTAYFVKSKIFIIMHKMQEIFSAYELMQIILFSIQECYIYIIKQKHNHE